MNRLSGRIAAIETHGSIALLDITIEGHRFTATLIGGGEEMAAWREGMPVALLFKETEVALAKNLSGLISLRNRFGCTVTGVERGKLLTRVKLDFRGHALESVITTRASHTLDIAVGDTVDGLVKANEMTVMAEDAA
jgi:molybdate transport system regulatory protein